MPYARSTICIPGRHVVALSAASVSWLIAMPGAISMNSAASSSSGMNPEHTVCRKPVSCGCSESRTVSARSSIAGDAITPWYRRGVASPVDPADAGAFERVQAVLRGERVPLDGGASKVMMFMLERPHGCDVRIAPGELSIWFGWNQGWHPYFPRTAPAIVSWLLERAGAGDPRELTAVLAPTTF